MQFKLRIAFEHAWAAKREIFKAQDSVNYVDGLEEIERELWKLRYQLEAFDRLCRRVSRESMENDEG